MSKGVEVRTCLYCGNDTKARWQICKKCLGEDKPRKLKPVPSPEEEEDEEQDILPSLTEYQGESDRDDL